MPGPRLVDSHCHLQFQAYRQDAPQVIREALAARIWMIVVGTQGTTSTQAVTTAERYAEGVYAAVGLHPNHLYFQEFEEDGLPVKTREERFDPDLYAPLAENSKVVAIGECGLDLYHVPADKDKKEILELQEKQLRVQISFADANDLPVIIHCRDAHQELIAVLSSVRKAGGLKRRGVIHSFTGNWQQAEKYLDLGFCLGFNGIITFPPKKGAIREQEELLEAARRTPPEAFLLETDAPYLSPVPRRGERNRPVYLTHVAEKMAELRGVAVERLTAMSVWNTHQLFPRIKISG